MSNVVKLDTSRPWLIIDNMTGRTIGKPHASQTAALVLADELDGNDWGRYGVFHKDRIPNRIARRAA